MNIGDPVWVIVDGVASRARVELFSKNLCSLAVTVDGCPLALLGDPETGEFIEIVTGRPVRVSFTDPKARPP